MSAVISKCGQYRYMLTRPAGVGTWRAPAMFIMLNPSTADASLDDPTIRRCRSFAQEWKCSGIIVVNLYALRSTDPSGLWSHSDPVGPENDAWLVEATKGTTEVVCAWGANAKPERVATVAKLLTRAAGQLRCLGTTKHGAPRHPLYVKGDTQLIDWTPP